jgi:hypothetical protein
VQPRESPRSYDDVDERDTETLLEEQLLHCQYCGKSHLREKGLNRHEARCDEADDYVQHPAEKVDNVGIVDAETYYTVGYNPETYHIDPECAEGRGRNVRERSREYVEWNDLDACYHCVSSVDTCADVQTEVATDGGTEQ